jgi:hypothetical protein
MGTVLDRNRTTTKVGGNKEKTVRINKSVLYFIG